MYVPSGRREKQQGYGHVRFRHPWAAGERRFFALPVVTLIASSFVLGMSDFVVVGILSDIAHGLRVSEVTVGNLVSRFATHLTLIGVFLAGNILCALAPNYAVLPHYSHMAKVGFLPQFRMRAGNGCLSALRLRTIPGR